MHPRLFTDQLNTPVQIGVPTQRIVSLVPSQTELLFNLGLDDRVVGITKFCVHPEAWRKTKTIIGGTKKFNFDQIDRLQPDLIIGNKEENYQEGIDRLRTKYPVWMSDIYSFDDAVSMIKSFGELTGTESRAAQILLHVNQAFAALPLTPRRVLYLIWQEPWMAAGKNTFIDAMLQKIGWQNVVQENRYPELTTEYITAINPDVILLSTEPFPFNDHHRLALHELVPASKVVLTDGEMFSWYGSRLVHAPRYFKELDDQLK